MKKIQSSNQNPKSKFSLIFICFLLTFPAYGILLNHTAGTCL